MQQAGCPALVSLSALHCLQGSVLNSHVTLIKLLTRQLFESMDNLVLQAAHFASRSFWQWPPLVFSIVDGALGLLHDDDAVPGVVEQAVSSALEFGTGVQKGVYQALTDHVYGVSIFPVLVRRSAKYFDRPFNFSDDHWSSVFRISTGMGAHFSCVL
eukprot:11925626-Karenia_brevis.AAC.1